MQINSTRTIKEHLPGPSKIFEKDDNLLSRLAFDNSSQANIISNISTGKIIMVNKAACKLLGYSAKGLLAKRSREIFNTRDKNFKNMLKQRKSEGQASALVSVFKKNGKLIPCEITSAVFTGERNVKNAITTISNKTESILKQKNIDIEKEKVVAGNIQLAINLQHKLDIKKQKTVARDIKIALSKSEARLAENNEWIKYIAKASYDVMWDWNVLTGKIYVGESVEETFGYMVKNNTMSLEEFLLHLLPEDKPAINEKLFLALQSTDRSWSDAYILKRADGSMAATTSRASIIRNEQGKAIRMIGATQDVSRIQSLEVQLEQHTLQPGKTDLFALAAKLSYDAIWDWNILTNEFFLGEGFEELFGYAYNDTTNISFDWTNFLYPVDKKVVEKSIKTALSSAVMHWEDAFRLIRADGSVANVFGRAAIIRDDSGKACRMIGVIHDMSRETELENALMQEITLKERQIIDASSDAKELERSEISKELHDNVNQLLGASRMFLELAKGGGESTALYLSRSSEYTLSAIDEIRRLTKGLSTGIIQNLGLCAAIENLAEEAMEVHPLKIACKLKKFSEADLHDKFKLNLFRIIQEHLTNVLKHAKALNVTIELLRDKEFIHLNVTDNGVGFDTCQKRKGIGISNIQSRVMTYTGEVEFVTKPSEGCKLVVKFPLTTLIKE
jgi:PAS domain S-box-containing protein